MTPSEQTHRNIARVQDELVGERNGVLGGCNCNDRRRIGRARNTEPAARRGCRSAALGSCVIAVSMAGNYLPVVDKSRMKSSRALSRSPAAYLRQG